VNHSPLDSRLYTYLVRQSPEFSGAKLVERVGFKLSKWCNFNNIENTAGTAKNEMNYQQFLASLPTNPARAWPTILKVDGDKRVHEESTHLLSLVKSRYRCLRSSLFHHLCRFVSLSSTSVGEGPSLPRPWIWWFTERFHRNALVTHF